jgi:hypothetical protein
LNDWEKNLLESMLHTGSPTGKQANVLAVLIAKAKMPLPKRRSRRGRGGR